MVRARVAGDLFANLKPKPCPQQQQQQQQQHRKQQQYLQPCPGGWIAQHGREWSARSTARWKKWRRRVTDGWNTREPSGRQHRARCERSTAAGIRSGERSFSLHFPCTLNVSDITADSIRTLNDVRLDMPRLLVSSGCIVPYHTNSHLWPRVYKFSGLV